MEGSEAGELFAALVQKAELCDYRGNATAPLACHVVIIEALLNIEFGKVLIVRENERRLLAQKRGRFVDIAHGTSSC